MTPKEAGIQKIEGNVIRRLERFENSNEFYDAYRSWLEINSEKVLLDVFRNTDVYISMYADWSTSEILRLESELDKMQTDLDDLRYAND